MSIPNSEFRIQNDKMDIASVVQEILAAADADIAARRPVCRSSGRCCRFEAYGHRLYVTAAEMEYFAHTMQQPAFDAPIQNQHAKIKHPISLPQFFAQAAEAQRGCPYQVDNLCTARDARPLGCRIYFCDENAQAWQSEVYEKYHAQLREVHARFNLPYRYLEWRDALREMMQSA